MSVPLNLPCHVRFSLPLVLSRAVSAFRFVDFDGNTASAGEGGYGVLQYDGAVGETVTCVTEGLMPVVAGATLGPNQAVQSNANGCAVPHTTGVLRGRTLPDTSALAGQQILVYLKPPSA
jgi:hypothetical protein